MISNNIKTCENVFYFQPCAEKHFLSNHSWCTLSAKAIKVAQKAFKQERKQEQKTNTFSQSHPIWLILVDSIV